nr:methyl-accepting chemotaxis protein [Halopiger xanaduensis]
MKFGVVITIIAILLIASSAYFYLDITSQITRDVQAEMEDNTAHNADEFEGWISDYEMTANTITRSKEFVNGSEAKIGSELRKHRRTLPAESQGVHYFDLGSKEVVRSTNSQMNGERIANLDVQVYDRSGAATTELAYDEIDSREFAGGFTDVYERNGEKLLAFISPIAGSDDRAVMIEVDIADVAYLFDGTVDEEEIRVFDASAETTVYAENESAILASGLGYAGAELPDGDAGAGIFEHQSTDSVLSYATVGETDWVVVSRAPQSTAYALADSVATSLLLLIAIAIAGFLVVGATLGRSTAAAMTDLATNARALSNGDTAISISDDDRIDEVGRVRGAFADTRDYLETAADQADAIARQEFDDPVLEADVPGKLGDSLATMRADLEQSIADLERSKTEAETAQADAAEARREAERLADRLEQKAAEFGDVMSKAAEGDLTQRLDEDVDNDALAEIATAFNEMLEDIEGTIVDIQTLAEDVDRTSADVTERVSEIERASDEVGRSTEEIASAASDQSERFQAVYGEMNDLSATVEEIASTAGDVATVSAAAADRADDASEASIEIRAEMKRLEDRAEAITEQVGQLESEMGEIGDIVDLIDDIAGQTNLLALNASIEAAGAGEEGDGFAVVANEVKSLAEETGEATQEVDALIDAVQASVEETVVEIDRMREQVDDGVDVVEDGIDAIDAIADQVETANDSIQSIDEATDEQARASERVVTMVDEATEISSETESETENVAAAVEEQTASISEVSSGTRSLTEMADDLRVSLAEFDVDESEGDANAIDADEGADIVLKHDSDESGSEGE